MTHKTRPIEYLFFAAFLGLGCNEPSPESSLSLGETTEEFNETDEEVSTDGDTDADIDESETGEDADESGCTPGERSCVGDDGIRFCTEDGHLQSLTCEGVCGSESASYGCFGESPDSVCQCGDSLSPCTNEGSTRCTDSDDIEICDDGLWHPYDCDSVCAEEGWAAHSCGYYAEYGHDVCNCQDPPCESGAAYCLDSQTVAYCNNGSWQSYDCDEACEGVGEAIACDYFAEFGSETCVCRTS